MQIKNLHSTASLPRRRQAAVQSTSRRNWDWNRRIEQTLAEVKKVKKREARWQKGQERTKQLEQNNNKGWLQLQDTNNAAIRHKQFLPQVISVYGDHAVQMAYASYSLALHAETETGSYQCMWCRCTADKDYQTTHCKIFSYPCYTHAACTDCAEMLEKLVNMNFFAAEVCPLCNASARTVLLEYLHTLQTSNFGVSPEVIADVAHQLGLSKVVIMKEFSIL